MRGGKGIYSLCHREVLRSFHFPHLSRSKPSFSVLSLVLNFALPPSITQNKTKQNSPVIVTYEVIFPLISTHLLILLNTVLLQIRLIL